MKRTVLVVITVLFVYLQLFAPPISEQVRKSIHYKVVDADRGILIEWGRYKEIRKIANSISKIETGNNDTLVGKDGELSKYQILPGTWVYWCNKYWGGELAMTEENQEKIVILVLNDWITKHKPDQIASLWNCNYIYYEGKVGVNKRGTPYNVPQYVKNFMKVYQDV